LIYAIRDRTGSTVFMCKERNHFSPFKTQVSPPGHLVHLRKNSFLFQLCLRF